MLQQHLETEHLRAPVDQRQHDGAEGDLHLGPGEKLIEHHQRHGVPFQLELRTRQKDGPHRWFLVHYRPLRDERANIVRWYATGTDIDDRKRTEERIRNENLALREEIDGSSMFEEIVGSSEALRQVLTQVANERAGVAS